MNVKARFSETKDKKYEYTIQTARQVLSALTVETWLPLSIRATTHLLWDEYNTIKLGLQERQESL